MKHISLIPVGIVLLLAGVFAYGYFTPDEHSASSQETIPSYGSDFAFRLWKETNKTRGENGKSEYSLSDCLSNQAEIRAKQIVETGIFAHTDKNGEKPYINLIRSCKFNGDISENLVWGYDSPETSNAGLMSSPSHRSAILGDYTIMGVGCYETTCVEFFAKP